MLDNVPYNIQISINDLPDNVVIYRFVDDDFIFIDVNNNVEITEGISKKEFLGKKLTEVFPGVKEFGLFKLLLKVHKDGKPQELDMSLYEDARISSWRKNSIRKLPNGDIIVFYKDMSEYKRLEIETENNKRAVDETQKIAHVGDWKWDMLINEITWSDETYRIFGEEPQSFTPTFEDFLSYLSNEDKTLLNEVITRSIQSGEPYNIEHHILRRDGEFCYVNGSGHTQFNENNEPIAMIGKVFDITKRKLELIQLQESEDKFRKLTESSLMGIFIYKKHFLYTNRAFEELLGYSSEELKTMAPWEIIEASYQEVVNETVKRRLRGEEFSKIHDDIKIVRKNGDVRTVRLIAQTIKYEQEYAGMGTMVDITDILETKEQLKLLGQAIEQTDEMISITDKNGVITYVNEALVAHTGYKKVELIGKNMNIFKAGQQDKNLYEDIWSTISSGKTYRGIMINKKKDKSIYYEEHTITPIFDDSKQIQHYVSTSQDITERIKMEEQLTELATRDSLTDIYNRHKINEEINSEMVRAKRFNEPFAIAMFDMDHFKEINDTYGHDIGDYVLQETTKLISKYIRESDSFGRWGGEEFLLIFPNLTQEEAMHTAEKLREIIGKHLFKEVSKVTISIGVSTYRKNETKKALLKRVDDALYEAKKAGRDRVVFR